MNTAPSTLLPGARFCAETHAPQPASSHPVIAGRLRDDARLALVYDTSAAPRSLCLPNTATGEHLVAAAV